MTCPLPYLLPIVFCCAVFSSIQAEEPPTRRSGFFSDSTLDTVAKPKKPTTLTRIYRRDIPVGNPRLGDPKAIKEFERLMAEEEAKYQAMLEEEQKRPPFVDDAEKLTQLDPKERIWVSLEKKQVIVNGRIAFREGPLELFACRAGSKEHESIVSVRVMPHLIHAALIVVGAKQGKPVEYDPEYKPATGQEIDIKVRWKGDGGKINEARAQDWVCDISASRKAGDTEKIPMTTHWVFTGSKLYKTDEGENIYIADQSGELISLSNFVGAILDIPIESTSANENLLFGCMTEKIPELGTPVTLVLTPVKKER